MALFLIKDCPGAKEGRDGGGAALPPDEIRKAHEMLDGMRSRRRGKIVLTFGA
jgi:hypothetical protein